MSHSDRYSSNLMGSRSFQNSNNFQNSGGLNLKNTNLMGSESSLNTGNLLNNGIFSTNGNLMNNRNLYNPGNLMKNNMNHLVNSDLGVRGNSGSSAMARNIIKNVLENTPTDTMQGNRSMLNALMHERYRRGENRSRFLSS